MKTRSSPKICESRLCKLCYHVKTEWDKGLNKVKLANKLAQLAAAVRYTIIKKRLVHE